MPTANAPSAPPISRRISAWWQGYDRVIEPATPGQLPAETGARNKTKTLRNRFDADADMAEILFGNGAVSPVNRHFVVPVVLPWLKPDTDRYHMIGQSGDWALALADHVNKPVDLVTDGKRNVDLMQEQRKHFAGSLPSLSIRSCDRMLAVTPSNDQTISQTMICVDVNRNRALTEYIGNFVQKTMQRGDEILILQFRNRAEQENIDELPASVGQAGPLENLPGLDVLDTRDVSGLMMEGIQTSFANWQQACDQAAQYRSAKAMHRSLLDLTLHWDRKYRNLQAGNCRYLAVRARKTVMSHP